MSLMNHRVNYEELKRRSTEDLQGELLYYAPEAVRARQQQFEANEYRELIEEARDAIAAELQRRME